MTKLPLITIFSFFFGVTALGQVSFQITTDTLCSGQQSIVSAQNINQETIIWQDSANLVWNTIASNSYFSTNAAGDSLTLSNVSTQDSVVYIRGVVFDTNNTQTATSVTYAVHLDGSYSLSITQQFDSICYNSNAGTLSIANPLSAQFSTIDWFSSTDSIVFAQFSSNNTSINLGQLASSNYYIALLSSQLGCQPDSSNVLEVTVYDSLIAPTISENDTICYSATPNSIGIVNMPTGGGGSFNYSWQESTDGTNFSTITAATNTSFSPGNLLDTTYYRLEATSILGCGSVFSNDLEIVVFDQITGNQISGDDTICYNTSPNMLISTVSPAGGGGLFNYSWLESLDGITYNAIPGANGNSYVPVSLVDTTYYRLEATSDFGCGIDTSNFISIRVLPDLTPSTIDSNQTICFGETPSQLFMTQVAQGGNSSFSYSWQQKINNTWVGIPSASGITYQPNSLTNTNYYRLQAVSDFGCGAVYSDSIEVFVYAELESGFIGNSDTICYNENSNQIGFVSLPSGGGGIYQYQWQLSQDSISFSNISGANASSYQSNNLIDDIYYRIKVFSQLGCGVDTSNIIKISVLDALTPPVISGDDTVCFNTSPNTLMNTISATGGGDIFSFSWLESNDGILFSSIPGATGPNHSPGNLLDTIFYKLEVTSDFGCGTDTSNSVTIEVLPDLQPPVIDSNQTICFGESPAQLFMTQAAQGGDSSFSYSWQQWVNNNWVAISSSSGTSYQPMSLTSTQNYRLEALSGFGCGAVYSNSVEVFVYSELYAGIIGQSDTICYNENTNQLAFTVTPSGGGGIYQYQWQESQDAVVYNDLVGANTSGYQGLSLIEDVYYKVAVISQLGCGSDTSNVVSVEVLDSLTRPSIVGDDTICFLDSTGSIQISVSPSGGNGLFDYQWQESINSQAWSSISGDTAISLSSQQPNVNTLYRISATSSFGCGDVLSDTVKVIVNPLPDTVPIIGETIICENQSDVEYFITTNNPLYEYNWDLGQGAIQKYYGDTGIVVSWNNSSINDLLALKQVNTNTQCKNEMTLEVVSNGIQAPNRSSIIQKPNTSILVCSDQTPGMNYQWGYFNKQDMTYELIPSANRRYVNINSPLDTARFTYCVETWLDDACKTKSCFAEHPFVNVSEIHENRVLLYPNPSQEHIQLKGLTGTISLQIINALGTSVLNYSGISTNSEELRIDISSFKSGFYILRIVDENNRITSLKFLKQ